MISYNLEGCCNESGGIITSSKKPRDTEKNMLKVKRYKIEYFQLYIRADYTMDSFFAATFYFSQ